MKVLTFNRMAFAEACRHLESAACSDGFRPDVVVGIESGGRYVAELIMNDIPHVYMALRRPSSAVKKGRVRAILSRLPRWLCDALRVVEARLLSLRKNSVRTFGGIVPDSLRGYRSILIVDDAVDSGATLLAVCEAVKTVCPDARIRTAVITTTTRRPLMVPDISMHNQLIRFPWSIDAHN